MPRNRRRNNKRSLAEVNGSEDADHGPATTKQGGNRAEEEHPETVMPSGLAAKAPRFGVISKKKKREATVGAGRKDNSSTSSSESDSSANSSSGSDSDSDDDGSENHRLLEQSMICNYKTIPVDVSFITAEDAASKIYTENLAHCTHIYLRVHQSKVKNSGGDDSDFSNRTIFVTNFTSMASTNDIANLFSSIDDVDVESVKFGSLNGKVSGLQDNWASGRVVLRYALVTLGSKGCVQRVMRWVQPNPLKWEIPVGSDSDHPVGVQGWLSHFQASQPSVESVMEEANRHMSEFMSKKETLRREMDARREAPDDDGFVLVSRKHTARSSGNTRASNRKSRRRNKRNGAGKELKDFYRFQLRETKRSKLAELRERFAEDKKRVDALRAKKKFKLASSR